MASPGGVCAGELEVGVVGPPEGEALGEPVLQRCVQGGVVAALVGGRGDPPADVDVVAVCELGGEGGAAAERVEVAAADVAVLGVVDGVCVRAVVAELALVP